VPRQETNAAKPEARQNQAAVILKDTLFTAVIAFAILGPIVGLKAEAPQGGLVLRERWGLALALVAIVTAGRLALNLFWWNQPQAKPSAARGEIIRRIEPLSKYFGIVLLVIAITLPFLPGIERRGVDLAILMLTYVMLGWGLNIVVGLAGLLDLGYVAFYAVGAYSYALLSTVYLPKFVGFLDTALAPWTFEWLLPWSFWIVLPLAGLLAALWGVILGFPVLRLRGDYLAIVTLAFGEIIRVILINWYDFTNGPNGISDIPRPSFFGYAFVNDDATGFIGLLKGFAAWLDSFLPLNWHPEFAPLQRIIFLYYVILALALVTNLVTLRLRRLPIGRAWEALREDEVACRSLGINTTNTKLTAFAMGAMFGGFAGSFFATRQGFVSPESFVFMESATILAIVVLGGLGSQIGVVIAAIAIIGAFEVFRELDFLRAVMPQGFDPTQYRMLAVGIAMVLIMRWRPRGLVTTREPSIFLKEKKAVSSELVAQGHG
jgi:branched-chain amino acid transport system permease protein